MKTGFAILIFCFAVLPFSAPAAVTWSGGGSNSNWFNPTNWSGGVLPGATDDVHIDTNGTGGPTLTGSVAVLTLTISNRTLTFQGTNTIFTASNLTVAGTSGKITHSLNTDTNDEDGWQMNNLIWIICTNCTVATGAAINVDYVGYPGGAGWVSGCGPGGGAGGSYAVGGGYGGTGGRGSDTAGGGITYGSSNAPVECGSGGGGTTRYPSGGAGGGYVRIAACGTITVNGTVTANGQAGAGDAVGGGSGGGMYLSCDTFSGGGVLMAKGGAGVTGKSGGGGGGRIAVTFNQATNCTIQYQASGGSGYQAGRPGTLWLSQYQGVLQELWTGGLALMTDTWSAANWTLTNVNTFAVLWPGFQLNVTGVVRALSSGAGIELGNTGVLTCASLALASASSLTLNPGASAFLTNGNLTASGGSAIMMYQDSAIDMAGFDANISGSSTLYLYQGAGFTNIQDFILGTSTVYSYCNNTSGVPSDAFVVRDFVVSTGSVVSADSAGYAGGDGVNSNGYGPGYGHGRAGWYGSGAGYGGRGGDSKSLLPGGDTYGSSNAPVDCGSGGGRPHSGGAGGSGGGYIKVAASRTITVDGTLTANGQTGGGDGSGGGSGGGIDLTCETIKGIGLIRANGGNGSNINGAGGGGGRIAAHFLYDNFYGTYSATNGTGYNNGSSGTVYRALQEGYLELLVDGRPRQHGDSKPYKYGSSGVISNSVVTNSVNSPADEDNGVRYGCIGWTGTGSVTPGGTDTQVVFTMTTDSTLTWLWTNQYYLTTTSGPNGNLVADMSGWYTNGTQVVVSASADEGYHFTMWSGDVPFADLTNNPLTVTMDQVRSVQANFAGDAGGDKVWIGGSSNWFSSEHWSPPGAPGELDAASITSAVTVTLSGSAVARSLVLSNATLLFQGTNTIFTASNLTVAGTSGKITHSLNTDTNDEDGWQMNNLIWIVCTNCTVATGAAINVDYVGYPGGAGWVSGCGPGGGAVGGYAAGGGYGGTGGRGSSTAEGGVTYGPSNAPVECGSGGGGTSRAPSGGAGGGYVRIAACGTITVNGTLTANGQAGAGDAVGGGSGGGMYLSCDTFTGEGVLMAKGGAGITGKSGGGGGGRIAVTFNQATNCTIRYQASGGSGYQTGRPGTLWLSHYQGVLPEIWTGGLELMTNTWSAANWTLTNVNTFAVLWPGFQLNVTGAVQAVGNGAGIELGSNGVITCASLALASASSLTLNPGASAFLTNGNLTASGGSAIMMYQDSAIDMAGFDANISGSSTLYLYQGAGFTNIQDFILGTSTVYSYCNNTSGVPSDAFVVRDFVVSTGSVVSADSAGYAGGDGVNSNGYGPGYGHGRAGWYGSGAGYGGRGGDSKSLLPGGDTYGSSNAPVDCGSGGGRPHSGGAGGSGGGYIKVAASRTITVDGTLTANGQTGGGDGSGGGSGGGIDLTCETIKGIGLIRASGGNGHASPSKGGGGGGGRIAVRCIFNHYLGTCSVTNGTGYNNGQVGTIYWRIQAPGTLFRIW